MVEEAVAAYAQSEHFRYVNDLNRFNAFRGTYTNLKHDLTGFTYSGTLDNLKTAVYRRIRGDATNATYAEVLSKYALYHIRSEVDRDESLAKVFQQLYDTQKIDVVGFTYSGVDLEADVKVYLPVDKDRENSIPIATLVQAGRDDLARFSTTFEKSIEYAKSELDSLNTWFDSRVKDALIECQELISPLQANHVNTFTFKNTTEEGYATTGTLPVDARPTRIRLRYVQKDENDENKYFDCTPGLYHWAERERLTHENKHVEEPKFTINTEGKFYIFPKLVSGFPAWVAGTEYATGALVEHNTNYYRATSAGTSGGTHPQENVGVTWTLYSYPVPNSLDIHWQGIKTDYGDGDETYFPDLLPRAIGRFVRHQSLEKFQRKRESEVAYREYLTLRKQVNASLKKRSNINDVQAIDLKYPIT